MTSVEESSPPEWLEKLEKREKLHRLAHEIGAGSPCLNCGDKCPGLDLHFWRKVCRNCKCKKEDHDVREDDNYPQFNILFGSNAPKQSRIKPQKTVLELHFKNGKGQSFPLDWTPPNVPASLAIAYLESLPQNKVPISNSTGALHRRRQLEKQIPLHDFDPNLCHDLTPSEIKHLQEYASNVKKKVVGQGRIVRVPIVRGFTTCSEAVPSVQKYNTSVLTSGTESSRQDNFRDHSKGHALPGQKEGKLSLESRNDEDSVPFNFCKDCYSESLGSDQPYKHDKKISRSVNNPREMEGQVETLCPFHAARESMVSVHNPKSYLEFSEALHSKPFHFKPSNENVIGNISKIPEINYRTHPLMGVVPSHIETESDFNSVDNSTLAEKKSVPDKLHSFHNEAGLNVSTVENKNDKLLNSKNMDPFVGKVGHKQYLYHSTDVENRNPNLSKIMTRHEGETQIPSRGSQLPRSTVGTTPSKSVFQGREENINNNYDYPEIQLAELKYDTETIPNELQALSLREEILCLQCGKVIALGSIAVTAEKKNRILTWHPECFVCASCQELLVDLLYFYCKGKVYCARDYAEICNVPRCYACDELIFMKSYTQAEGQSFHLRHFCCLECDIPLADKEYLPMNGHPICLPCYHKKYAKNCHSCHEVIAATEKTVRLNEFTWHATDKCFSCHHCHKSLLNSKFSLKNSKPYCCNQMCLKV